MGHKKPLAPALRDLWHVVATSHEVPMGGRRVTTLFETALSVSRNERLRVARHDDGSLLPVIERYGCIWTSFGTPTADLFPIIEYTESDRRNLIAGSIGMNVSASRAIENFVETGQIRSDAGDSPGVEPFSRLPHPHCALLYGTYPADNTRHDIVAIFCQPMTARTIRAHVMLSVVDDDTADLRIRRFGQPVFSAPRPMPGGRRLPLLPSVIGRSTSASRHWPSQQGHSHGASAPPA